MVIGVCGLGYTGSGAVIDLLKEYEGIQVQRGGEFWLSYRPDGLEDLAYHVNNPSRFTSGDVAIMRFKKLIESFSSHPSKWGLPSSRPIIELTDRYISSISQLKWRGFWTVDARLSTGLEFHFKWRLLKKLYYKYPQRFEKLANRYLSRDMFLAYNPDHFYEASRKYMTALLGLLGYDDNQLLFLDQGFSGDNPMRSYPFFKNPKAIVVDKDPRDLYVLCKKEVYTDCRWVPTENVDDYIKYYRIIRSNYLDLNHPNVLLIKFEDLIYKYADVIGTIESFCGISPTQHIAQFTHFNPEVSKNNTQLFRKYPELEEDIAKIESSLPEYLYDFSSFEVKKEFGKAF